MNFDKKFEDVYNNIMISTSMNYESTGVTKLDIQNPKHNKIINSSKEKFKHEQSKTRRK